MNNAKHIRRKARGKVRRGMSDRLFNGIVVSLMVIFLIIIIYPLIYILSSSFSSGNAVSSGRVIFLPVEFSLTGYELVLKNRMVWSGYLNTIFYTVVGTLINLVMTVMSAYPLSRKTFQGRKFFTVLFTVTMFFGGGLIPTYMLMSNLHLVNTRMVMLVAGALSVYNMVLMRTFFQNSIPGELLESAKMDGISDAGYLMKIVLPLSKAIISVITLYYVVGHWNSYFDALVYLRDRDLYPLQLVLREVLLVSRVSLTDIDDAEVLAKMTGAADLMKFSLIVIAVVPMLVIYPFVQKFFEKGVMIGSLKG